MKKIYYKNNGFVCDRYPYDLKPEENDPFIEVSDDDFELTIGTPTSRIPVVKDGKFAYIDYERYINSYEYNRDKILREIRKLKKALSETDYVVTKLQESKLIDDSSTYSTLQANYKDKITERKQTRNKINELEAELDNLSNEYKPLAEIEDKQLPEELKQFQREQE